MKRREFVSLLGGAVAWPLGARAQERVRRIGVLMSLAEVDPETKRRIGAFLERLRQLGWADGGNAQINYRWGGGNPNDIRRYAAELAALAPDVILATGSVTVGPLLEVTRTVPIVFVQVPDPVAAGFVDSLARPGGNATGFVNFEYGMGAKWLELLKQIAPAVTRVGVFAIPRWPSARASTARSSRWRLRLRWRRARSICETPGRSSAASQILHASPTAA